MNRFIRIKRLFKRLFVPVLSHDAAQEADKRDKIAQKITDDQIYVQTVRNALKVDDATSSDKLTFAFSSLPDASTNFKYAKTMFFDILEFLMSTKEVTSEEVNIFKALLENINSFEELMMVS
ncbi:MAG: hypothetical protein JSV04_14120 [Candidatus Heimdallarchaeota archaeon]|nr:MAG: hypothetical protein JSV04_14120 [Candidatus Heimdallarchaeota archaeon]